MTNIASTVNVEQEKPQEIYSDLEARRILQFLLRNITVVISPQSSPN